MGCWIIRQMSLLYNMIRFSLPGCLGLFAVSEWKKAYTMQYKKKTPPKTPRSRYVYGNALFGKDVRDGMNATPMF